MEDNHYTLQICPWEEMRQYSHFTFIPPKEVSKQELEKYLESVKKFRQGSSSYSGYDLYENSETGERWLVKVTTKSPHISKT